MLYQLIQYADQAKLCCAPGYEKKMVKAIVTVRPDGRFLQAESAALEVYAPTLSMPEMVFGGETRSHFLVDSMGTVSGTGNERSKDKQKAFADLHRKAASAIDQIVPISKMLDDPAQMEEMTRQLAQIKVKPGDNITFRIAGQDRCVVEQDAWKDWWRQYRAELTPKKQSERMRCFATGDLVEPAFTHPKLKLAKVDGQSTGSTLIGFDKKSFTSFGLEQSANAACSEESAAVYAGVLNDLIGKAPKPLANTLLLYWLDRLVPPEENPLHLLTEIIETSEEETEKLQALKTIKRLAEAVRTGERPVYMGNRYHVILISGAAGRAMVRSAFEGDLVGLYERIDDWFDDLSLVASHGGIAADPPKLYAMLIRELPYQPNILLKDLQDAINKQLAPLVVRIWDSILCGSPFPQEAARRAFRHLKSRLLRAREDDKEHGLENIDRIACAMLKMWYNRAVKHGIITNGGVKVETRLNTGHPSPAYHAGRLLAVLNHLQHTALENVGADVVQRFFSAASVTPGLVIGRLVNGAQPHLNKLRREEKMGLYIWYQQMIGEIMSHLDDRLLEQLDFAGQTLFALGYYHQFASLFEKSGDTIQENEEEKDHGASESI